MAQFSPALMARLHSVVVPMSRPYYGGKPEEKRMYQFRGTWSEWIGFCRDAMADRTEASARMNAYVQRALPSPWAGIDETAAQVLETGTYSRAQREFQQTRAKLEAQHYQADTPRPIVAGGAWIIPLVLGSNPLPARIRPRSKLPPLNLEFSLSVSCAIDSKAISDSVARIARAAWDYIQAGGAITLTVHYSTEFHRDELGHAGFLQSIRIPTTNIAAFASSISAQEFRGFHIGVSKALSGLKGDSLPVSLLSTPKMIQIHGKPEKDAPGLATMRIK